MFKAPTLLHVEQRCSELGLSERDFMKRLGFADLGKARHRLERLYAGNFRKSGFIINQLPAILKVTKEDVQGWLDEQRAAEAAQRRALWNADFTPHAIIITGNRTLPRASIFVCAMINAGRFRRVDFPESLPQEGYFAAVLDAIRERHRELKLFYPPEGMVIHYSTSRFVHYDLEGKVLQERTEPYYDGQFRLSI